MTLIHSTLVLCVTNLILEVHVEGLYFCMVIRVITLHMESIHRPFNSNSNLEEYHFGLLYGFGYDESRDDYLIVSISCGQTSSSHLEFFSLKDNTWKEIEGTHPACI
jgi:hypothetical protein